MHLDVRGHPLHTRALGVTLTHRDAGTLAVDASLLDLRKCGFVPVGGDLQPAGIVHDMRLSGVVAPRAGGLQTISAEQRAVAFEPSVATGGESCRDPIGRIEALAGVPFGDAWTRRLGEAVGGNRGCSHLLTLGHLLGSTVTWALARDRARFGDAPSRAAGARVFRRDVVVDGHQAAAGGFALALQLTDLHLAPASNDARPMDRYAGDLAVRAQVAVDGPTMAVTEVVIAERRRTADTHESTEWRMREDVAAAIRGVGLGSGATAALRERVTDADDRPLLDALLMLAPTIVQCWAARSDVWPTMAERGGGVVGLGGLPDSCYMWRRDGTLQRARRVEAGVSVGTQPRRT